MKNERNSAELGIPKAGSLIITHDINGLFPGLKNFKPQDRPPVLPVFVMFRVMVGLGLIFVLIGLVGATRWLRGKLFVTGWYLRLLHYCWPLGFIAILSGWMVTEIGRQPWLATGILRTVDAGSPVAPAAVATSLLLFIIVYASVFSIGIWYIKKLIDIGPNRAKNAPDSEQAEPSPKSQDPFIAHPLSIADQVLKERP